MADARYKHLVDSLAADIREGRLRPGERLPPHRRLAKTHKLALATASRVYAELEAMGLVVAELGRGTFVRHPAYPHDMSQDLLPTTPTVADLIMNSPNVPGQDQQLRTALRRLASAGNLKASLHHQPNGGHAHDRDIVAHHLQARGLRVSGEQVAFVSGAQHGLSVVLMALLRPGAVIAVEALSYPGFRVLADLLGMELAPVQIGPDGLDTDALAQLCRSRPVKAVYTMPTLHNPLGLVTSETSRQRLAQIAREHDLLVIEDAPWAYLAAEAPPPLATFAPERTVYISGLSNSVAPGLRFGFVAADAPRIARIERAIRATTAYAPGLITSLACSWIADGTVAKLEEQKREDARQRQALVGEILAGLPMQRHPTSYFVWLPLREDSRADRVAAALADSGISVSTAEPFATTAHVPQAIRLGLGAAETDLETLRTALPVVREVVEWDGL